MGEWQKVTLRNLLVESNIESKIPNVERRIRVLLNAKGIIKRPAMNEKQGVTRYFIRKKRQFIYGKQNLHKGAFGIIPDELDGFESSSDLPAFDVDKSCLPEWIDYFFKQGNYYLTMESIARGVATKRVQPKELLNVEISLPSVEEQKKITYSFKNIETEERELKNELTYQQTLLKKLWQQILQEAIEGKLTADWREQNPDIEPASKLLERIEKEKAQLIKDKKIKPQKLVPPITETEKKIVLPKWWCFSSLANCSINKDEFRIPVTKSDRDRRKKIYDYYGASSVIDKIDGYTHQGRHLLIGEDGANLTARTTPIAFFADGKFWVNNHAHVIGTVHSITLDYLWVHINAIDLAPYISGGFQPKLSQANLNRIKINFPPLAEQKAIVAKVEKLLAICDQLESQVKTNQSHAKELMQAVLKEAFTQSDNKPPQTC